MSTQWQWQEGHGAGHLQRVTNSAAYNRAQKAHQAYTEHRSACEVCPEECPEAEALWQAYRKANGGSVG